MVMTKIVGFKHRNIDHNLLKKFIANEIYLEHEPTNKFDKNAIKCISSGTHFGYIEKIKSEYIVSLLKESKSYKINVISFDEFKVSIDIEFLTINKIETIPKIEIGNVAGIYEISFSDDGNKFCYVGQSTNINSRLQSHYNKLKNLSHHNIYLQNAWIKNPSTFRHKVLEICPKHFDPLAQQIFLFEKEMYYIQESLTQTVNLIDADLVFTNEAFSNLKNIINNIKLKLKPIRLSYLSTKEKIGQKVIDEGIIKEHKVSDGWQRGGESKRYLTIKASNVLSWLKKTRRSPLDYIPPINREHHMYDVLLTKLKEEQDKIFIIDNEKKFLDNFLKSFKQKNEYETCDILEVKKFIKIINKYKN